MREASSLVLSARLQGEGATVVAYDPVAADAPPGCCRRSRWRPAPRRRSRGADAAILVTEWPEFARARLAGDGAGDEHAAARRRPQLPRSRGAPRGRASPTRASGAGPRGRRSPLPAATDLRMQALILVGGHGTRLRPVTLTLPKPAIPLVDRPFIRYMIDWLARHGVDDIVMACGFLPDALRAGARRRDPGGPRLRYVEEPEPRGTAGAIKFAEDLLDDRFFALNGDVLTDLDLTALRDAARGQRRPRRRWRSTRSTTRPPTASCAARDDGEIIEFLEKPDPRRDRHRRDQRRRLRAREGGPRPVPPDQRRLDRARGLPAARRQRPLLAAPRGLLDGHRHARALPAGLLGHPRAQTSRPSPATLVDGDGVYVEPLRPRSPRTRRSPGPPSSTPGPAIGAGAALGAAGRDRPPARAVGERARDQRLRAPWRLRDRRGRTRRAGRSSPPGRWSRSGATVAELSVIGEGDDHRVGADLERRRRVQPGETA